MYGTFCHDKVSLVVLSEYYNIIEWLCRAHASHGSSSPSSMVARKNWAPHSTSTVKTQYARPMRGDLTPASESVSDGIESDVTGIVRKIASIQTVLKNDLILCPL